MKKLFMKLLAGLMALGCVCLMVACSPKLNIDRAEETLREKGYRVEVVHNAEFYHVGGLLEKVVYAERDDTNISIMQFSDRKTAKLVYNSEREALEIEIETMESYIKFYEHILDEYEGKLLSDQIDEIEDEIKEYQQQKEELEEALKCVGRNGIYVWVANSMDIIENAQ